MCYTLYECITLIFLIKQLFSGALMKTVMAFGTFDVLHPGHIAYLEQAKRMGDRLVVVVARDSSVAIIKGRRPIFGEKERLEIVSSLRVVDKAVLGAEVKTEGGRFGIIRRFHPSVIALGMSIIKIDKRIKARVTRMLIEMGMPGKLRTARKPSHKRAR